MRQLNNEKFHANATFTHTHKERHTCTHTHKEHTPIYKHTEAHTQKYIYTERDTYAHVRRLYKGQLALVANKRGAFS